QTGEQLPGHAGGGTAQMDDQRRRDGSGVHEGARDQLVAARQGRCPGPPADSFDVVRRGGYGVNQMGAPRAMRQLRWLLVALAAIGCGLPKNVVRPPSSALVDTRHTTLGKLIPPAVAKHPGESGFLLFNTGEGGIQARVAMADVAESSIDAQYFMWGRDTVGRVLMDRLIAAADRGVRVRVLIDDYWASGHDPAFQAIAAHPNIEVRVFNPFSRGRMRVTQFLGRFTELNRRMHNKLFVADGQVAVVGGRNLMDEYFGLGEEICYRDFDLLAIGPVLSQSEAGFDSYWNSQWTYPVSSLVNPASQAERD